MGVSAMDPRPHLFEHSVLAAWRSTQRVPVDSTQDIKVGEGAAGVGRASAAADEEALPSNKSTVSLWFQYGRHNSR
jgi:hypothetical protein